MSFARITVDPNVMQGTPCVRGMRITVGLVVNLVANRMPLEEILKNYPDLEAEDIQECLQYAAVQVQRNPPRSIGTRTVKRAPPSSRLS